MEIIRKQLTLTRNEYFIKHLSIVNIFLPKDLTPKEIEVIAAFMSLEGDIALDRFGTSARKIVREKMKISPGGLGNYLSTLEEKGFLIKEDNTFKILPILHPDNDEQKYQFILRRV